MPQINPQSLLFKIKLKNQVSLFRGLEPKSGPSHSFWSNHLTAPGRAQSGARPGPLDSNRAAHLRVPLRRFDLFSAVGSKSRGSSFVVLLQLARRVARVSAVGRGKSWASSVLSLPRPRQRVRAFNAGQCTAPVCPLFTCSRRSSRLCAAENPERTRDTPSRCSLPS